MKNNRIKKLDVLKFISILIICSSHFIYEKRIELPHVINIINGKFGVSLLFVISGFLSYKSKEKNISSYLIRRYIYFLVCAFFINSVYYIFNINNSQEIMTYGYVIGQSLILGDDIFPTFWFAKDMLLANLICYIIGKYKIKYENIIILLIFIFINKPFISICIMGTLVEDFVEKNRIINKYIRSILFLLTILITVCVLLLFNESNYMYVIYGILSLLLVSFSFINNSFLFNNNVLSYFGKKTMAIMLIHPLIIEISIKNDFSFFIFIVLVLTVSILIDKLLNYVILFVNIVINKLFLI